MNSPPFNPSPGPKVLPQTSACKQSAGAMKSSPERPEEPAPEVLALPDCPDLSSLTVVLFLLPHAYYPLNSPTILGHIQTRHQGSVSRFHPLSTSLIQNYHLEPQIFIFSLSLSSPIHPYGPISHLLSKLLL